MSRNRAGTSTSSQVRLHLAQVRVDELMHPADVVGGGGLHGEQVEALADVEERDRPVLQQVLVADERPRRPAGRTLGVQHHVTHAAVRSISPKRVA
jgi:hypothetical protein